MSGNYTTNHATISGAPVILDVAINGIRSRAMNPNIPIGAEAISAEALACIDAGASIVHAHNTDPNLVAEAAADAYGKIWAPVLKQRPGTLWYPTLVRAENAAATGVEHVEILAKKHGLEIGPLDPGSVNIGTHLVGGVPTGMVHFVDPERVRRQFSLYHELGLAAAMGIYEPGYLRTALAFDRAGLIRPGSSLNFYFVDEYGFLSMEPACSCGLPPEPKYLDVYLSLMEGCNLPWFVSVWGKTDSNALKLLEYALALGGHIQIGLETYFSPDENPTNLELMEQVKSLASQAGRPIATPDQARRILGLAAVEPAPEVSSLARQF